jgi:hypothetical protein
MDELPGGLGAADWNGDGVVDLVATGSECALTIAEKSLIQAVTRIQEGDEDPFS